MEYNFNTPYWQFVRQNWKIGFVCSSFDLLHTGHILMLKDAKSVCDFLVAGLQTDSSIDRIYKNSPIQSFEERYEQLLAVEYVTKIIKYKTDNDLLQLLIELKPDIRILGTDWKEREDKIIGKEVASIYWHDRSVHTYSTTDLRNRVYKAERVKRFFEDGT